jgi:capsular exopolysaccharide synthesis family protein
LSKIYEAVKKAAEDRERIRPRPARPVMAAVGKGGAAAVAEDYQKLRANLVSISVPSGLHTILVTASRHREGTTTVAIGLATTLAKERESRVLLVEANFRSPSFAAMLSLASQYGVADFAAGRAAPEALANRVDEVNLLVIPTGMVPPQGISVESVDALVTRLRPQYDLIVIDAPPVNSYADASVLASKVDGVILVIEADQTPVFEAEMAKRQLDRVGARILGVVLNRRRSYIPAFLESIL